MAERQPGLNAFGDPSNINYFGLDNTDQQEEYRNILQNSVDALQMRYAQPNWWKVAAGFAKPQLGGFMASLGSAAEAMGENVEQQRASMLPIAQMRAQLAMQNIAMGQNKKAAEMYQEHLDNGAPPEELSGLVTRLTATAPNAPSTKAALQQYASMQKERELAASEQAAAIGRIQTAYHYNEEPNPADLAFVRSGSPTLATSTARPKKGSAGPSDLGKANADWFGTTNFKENPDLAAPSADTGAFSSAVKTPPPSVGDKPVLTKNLPDANAASLPPADATSAGIKQYEANMIGLPDVTSLYNNSKIKNPKAEAFRAGTLSNEYAKAMQNYYDAAHNGDAQGAERAGGDLAAISRELKRMGLQPPEMGAPTDGVSPATKPAAPVISAPAPAAKPAASKSIFPDPIPVESGKYPVLHPETPAADLAGMSTVRQNQVIENRKAQAAISEEAAIPTINSLLPYTNNSITIPLYQSLKASKSNIDKYPQYARRFYDVLGQGKLDSQIAKAFQEGGGLSWNALVNGNASFNIPAKAWVAAGLPEEIASFGNTQLTERAKQIALEAQLNGTRIDKIPVAEFHTVSAANPGENMRWDAARHALNVDATDVYFKSQLARQYQHEIQNHAYAPNEMAPKSAIMKHSPNIKSLYNIWAEQKDRIQRERQKELESKKP